MPRTILGYVVSFTGKHQVGLALLSVAVFLLSALRNIVRVADIESAIELQSRREAGIEVAMVLEEVEPIGGFTGVSLSEPLLQGGILASVICYMVFLNLNLNLVVLGLAFFVPQMVVVPLLQSAINRRAEARILTKRTISGAIVEGVALDGEK